MTTSTNDTISSADVLNQHLTLISISISTFGGYRRATREAISKLGGNLPSCKAITEGSIKVFPAEPLGPIHTIRHGLFRKMAKRGIKALGSSNVFGIPSATLDEALREIAAAELEFKTNCAIIEDKYEDLFEEHVRANSEAEEVIRAKKFSKSEALSKLSFSKSVFRIQPELREGEDAEQGVRGIVEGLGRQLFEEVAAEMDKLLKNDAFAKHNRVGQKTLRPLRAVAKKMAGLAFLDERNVEGIIRLIDDTLSLLPSQGYIEDTGIDQPFSLLRRLVETLADADDLVNAAGKICNGISARDVLVPPLIVEVAEEPVVPQAVEASSETVQTHVPAETTSPVRSVYPPSPTALPPLPLAAIPVLPPPAPARVAVPMF